MSTEDSEPLSIAVRVYAVGDASESPTQRTPSRRRKVKRREPFRTIVFDTETTTDATQRFLFGVWRYYLDRWNSTPGSFCETEGIVYADDLPQRDPDAMAALECYVETHPADVAPGRDTRIRLLSRSLFIERVLWRHGHEHRATVVGFNLPFDLSRLALAASEARRRKRTTTFVGGHSLKLWANEVYRPRLDVKSVDSKRTLMGFTTANEALHPFHGHFLDLRTLSFALTDRGHSLESACETFGVPYAKRSVELGRMTENTVDYCREDVAATAALYGATMAEFRRHPIEGFQVTKAFSPASIGKAYLSAMGVRPILTRQPDFDPKVLGWGMSAFFGGRAECRIRKVPLPVVYVDFRSMYPTVNALMGSWDLVTARRIAVDDVTDKVRRLLAAPDLAQRAFSKAFWRQLACLVEIEPDGNLLPVRAAYDPASDYGIGVNPFRSRQPAWYALGDVLASVIGTGRVPKVRQALALRAVGRQGGLKALRVRGMVEVDPAEGDFFRQLIELRRQVEQDPHLGEQERDRLSGFLKILANATSYGILAEFVRHERHDPVGVEVFADGEDPFATSTRTPETPGAFCFPPLAATITAGARLMLALLEHTLTDAGGSYVFCDTDSMAIVADESGGLHACPGGPHDLPDGVPAVQALS